MQDQKSIGHRKIESFADDSNSIDEYIENDKGYILYEVDNFDT